MSIIFVLIIISLTVALGFLAAFLWAVKSGQFDDDYTPSVRILFDDNDPAEKQSALNDDISEKDQSKNKNEDQTINEN